jgi:hypothetical protein
MIRTITKLIEIRDIEIQKYQREVMFFCLYIWFEYLFKNEWIKNRKERSRSLEQIGKYKNIKYYS